MTYVFFENTIVIIRIFNRLLNCFLFFTAIKNCLEFFNKRYSIELFIIKIIVDITNSILFNTELKIDLNYRFLSILQKRQETFK